MKYGAVCSPPLPAGWTFSDKVNILQRIVPQTVRVAMFYGNASTRQFSDSQLDLLLVTGLTEMIIQSSETADETAAQSELNQFIGYVGAHPSTLFGYELGNEPDQHESATTARYERLTTIRDIKPQYAQYTNLLWAINMASQNATADYFNAFVLDPGDGLGNLLTGPYKPDLVTVHCYGYNTLCRTDGDQPYKLIDWVRGWNGTINIKVTECGIGSTASDRPNQYVEFAEKVGLPQTMTRGGGGNLDSVCFYGLPQVEDPYNIDGPFADVIGSRAASSYCG